MFRYKNYFILTITFLSVLGFLYYYFFRNDVIGFSWLGVHKVAQYDFYLTTYFLWLPTFIHPFLLSLLTWWAMGFSYPKTSVLFWMIINLIAEIGQGIEKSFFDKFHPILKNYFQNGVFDWVDILSIIFGAIFAYAFILKLKKD